MPEQQSPNFPDSFYRVTVKGICVREGKVLMVRDLTGRNNSDPSPEWELPGGGLDFGENFKEGFVREVKEEMGLKVSWMADKPSFVWTVKRPNSRQMEWYWVLALFFQFEVEDLNFTKSPECDEIKFFSKEDMLTNIDDLALQVRPLAEVFDPKDFI